MRWVDGRQNPQSKIIAAAEQLLPTPLTLKNLFDTDFQNYYRVAGGFTILSTGHTHHYDIPFSLLIDLKAHSIFVAAFIPDDINIQIPYELSILVAQHHQTFIDKISHQLAVGNQVAW
jgi:hypothetical protein